MKLEAIARAYVSCVELDERAQSSGSGLAEDVSSLRSDLHALLMEALREARIPFADRQEAARIAFDIANGRRKTA